MTQLKSRDVEYRCGTVRMVGRYVVPDDGGSARPGIVILHDAFGRGPAMIGHAERLAGLGFAVLAADLWGEATEPRHESDIGPLIGAMVGDRSEWHARVDAAHRALAAQSEVDAAHLANVGFCFGGSSGIEYVRRGGAVRGAVSVHGGLDLLGWDWTAAHRDAQVLLCTGAADPMATREQLHELETVMSAAGVGWEVDLYSGARHAFTNPFADRSEQPDVFAYDPRAAARAWAATERFLTEILPAPSGHPRPAHRGR